VNAQYRRSKELSLSWRTRGMRAEISVSDYLMNAPDDVLSDLGVTLAGMMSGRRPSYGDKYLEYICSKAFLNRNRPTYIRRSKNLSRSPCGTSRDLRDSLTKLLDAGLISNGDIDGAYLSWTLHPNIRRIGYCSPVMKTVVISCILDDPSIPESVLNYVVYHECLHLKQGYRPYARPHDREFRRMESLFPGKDRADAVLHNLQIKR